MAGQSAALYHDAVDAKMIDRLTLIMTTTTDMRYLIPFSRAVKHAMPDLGQSFSVQRWGKKYNGLSDPGNYELTMDRLSTYCGYATIHETNDADVAVQVETGSILDCKRRIAIQHGFDTAFLIKDLSNIDAYLCTSTMMLEFALGQGMKNALAPPAPISCWGFEHADIEQQERRVTVFYPDSGDADVAERVVDRLLAAQFEVIVKQRRKHQMIRCAGKHVYDDVWFPSESIINPMSSAFTVGFGSSAYTDLTAVGLNYVNIDLHHSRFPWNVFVHPDSQNYMRVTDIDDVERAIDHAIALFRPVHLSCIDPSTFIRSILA